jgi:hypothetical protein
LLALLDQTSVSEEARGRIHTHIAKDFGEHGTGIDDDTKE